MESSLDLFLGNSLSLMQGLGLARSGDSHTKIEEQ